jgi:hypothetical protein
MWVRAWSNGRPVASGAGYGLKVSRADRDHHFKSSWRSVRLLFQDGECISVPVSASFWRATVLSCAAAPSVAGYSVSASRPGLAASRQRFASNLTVMIAFSLLGSRG